MAGRQVAFGLVLLVVSLSMLGCGVKIVDSTLMSERDAARAQVATLQLELEGKENDLEEARQSLAVAQIELAASDRDLEASRQELTAAQALLPPLESEIAALNGELESLRAQVSSMEEDVAWQKARQRESFDQTPEPPWTEGFSYINPATDVGQSFVPSYPILTAVEVNIRTANPARGDDTLTLEIRDGEGTVLASGSMDVENGFDGWLRFDLEEGADVPVGLPLVIRLADSGGVVFGWKYFGGDYYESGTRMEGDQAMGGDFLFRTFGLRTRE
jgi:hypothetical protein